MSAYRMSPQRLKLFRLINTRAPFECTPTRLAAELGVTIQCISAQLKQARDAEFLNQDNQLTDRARLFTNIKEPTDEQIRQETN